EFTCGNTGQSGGIYLVSDANLRRAGNHRRYAAQLETVQGAANTDQFALTLKDMDGPRGLAGLVGGEILRPRDRNGGIARDDLLHQPAHGLQAEGQGDDVEQEKLLALPAPVARQRVGLDGRTDGDHLVGIDIGQRFAPEQLGDRLADPRHAGGAADHDHRLDLADFDAGIAYRAAAGLEAARDHGLDQLLETLAAQQSLPSAVAQGNRRLLAE